MKEPITIETTINAPIEKIWEYMNNPEHITKWCFAQDDWHAPRAENDLRVGGKLLTRMEAKDGSFGFDFGGSYTAVEENKLIEYVLGDGRKVKVEFIKEPEAYRVVQTFDPEDQNTREKQREGWQAILDNFKKHVINN